MDNSLNEKNIEENTDAKAVEFDVTMSSSILYDYMINHAYSGASGIIGTCFGALSIIMFLSKGVDGLLYLVFGIALILYLPVTLFMKSKQLMVLSPAYKKPLHYVIDDKGITVSQGEDSQTVEWSKCTKAVSTKQSIAVYTGKNNASVFPRKQLGDKLSPFIAVLAENMDPKKVKIRF